MKKQTFVILSMIVFLLFSQHTIADKDQAFKPEHPYIQFGLGGSIAETENYATIKLAGGIDLNKRYGVEAGMTLITDIFVADVDMLYLSFVAKYPIGEKTTLAGKVGVVRWDTTTHVLSFQPGDDSGVNAMLGVDLKYDLFSQLAIVLSFEYYGSVNVGKTTGDETIFPGTVSLRYTF